MRKEKAMEMQIKLAHEAAMMIQLAGSNHDTQSFENAIRLIGKAWSLEEKDTERSLLLIDKEREAMVELEKGTPLLMQHYQSLLLRRQRVQALKWINGVLSLI